MVAAVVFCLLAFPTRQETANQIVDRFVTETGAVGMQVAVYRDGQPIYSAERGYADFESQRRVDPKTLFRLASISKPITAVGVVKLVEEGKLSLDQDATRWIPKWPKDHPKITLRQLLSHTSGVRHYNGISDPKGDQTYRRASDAVDLFIRDFPIFAPGQRQGYSTHAYTLVANAIETASGLPFADYMRQEVFRYAEGEMDVEYRSDVKPQRSELYTLNAERKPVRSEPREDLSWKFGGGGMEATANGLAKWASKLMQGRVIQPWNLNTMWTPTRLNDGKLEDYGLGFSLEKDGIVGHNGAQQGARSLLRIDPRRRIVTVILVNTAARLELEPLADQLTKLFVPPGG